MGLMSIPCCDVRSIPKIDGPRFVSAGWYHFVTLTKYGQVTTFVPTTPIIKTKTDWPQSAFSGGGFEFAKRHWDPAYDTGNQNPDGSPILGATVYDRDEDGSLIYPTIGTGEYWYKYRTPGNTLEAALDDFGNINKLIFSYRRSRNRYDQHGFFTWGQVDCTRDMDNPEVGLYGECNNQTNFKSRDFSPPNLWHKNKCCTPISATSVKAKFKLGGAAGDYLELDAKDVDLTNNTYIYFYANASDLAQPFSPWVVEPCEQLDGIHRITKFSLINFPASYMKEDSSFQIVINLVNGLTADIFHCFEFDNANECVGGPGCSSDANDPNNVAHHWSLKQGEDFSGVQFTINNEMGAGRVSALNWGGRNIVPSLSRLAKETSLLVFTTGNGGRAFRSFVETEPNSAAVYLPTVCPNVGGGEFGTPTKECAGKCLYQSGDAGSLDSYYTFWDNVTPKHSGWINNVGESPELGVTLTVYYSEEQPHLMCDWKKAEKAGRSAGTMGPMISQEVNHEPMARVAPRDHPLATPVLPSPARDVVCGAYHVIARLVDNTIVAWGLNSMGQVNVPDSLQPSCKEKGICHPKLNKIASIHAGFSTSAVFFNDGTAFCWGDPDIADEVNNEWKHIRTSPIKRTEEDTQTSAIAGDSIGYPECLPGEDCGQTENWVPQNKYIGGSWNANTDWFGHWHGNSTPVFPHFDLGVITDRVYPVNWSNVFGTPDKLVTRADSVNIESGDIAGDPYEAEYSYKYACKPSPGAPDGSSPCSKQGKIITDYAVAMLRTGQIVTTRKEVNGSNNAPLDRKSENKLCRDCSSDRKLVKADGVIKSEHRTGYVFTEFASGHDEKSCTDSHHWGGRYVNDDAHEYCFKNPCPYKTASGGEVPNGECWPEVDCLQQTIDFTGGGRCPETMMCDAFKTWGISASDCGNSYGMLDAFRPEGVGCLSSYNGEYGYDPRWAGFADQWTSAGHVFGVGQTMFGYVDRVTNRNNPIWNTHEDSYGWATLTAPVVRFRGPCPSCFYICGNKKAYQSYNHCGARIGQDDPCDYICPSGSRGNNVAELLGDIGSLGYFRYPEHMLGYGLVAGTNTTTWFTPKRMFSDEILQMVASQSPDGDTNLRENPAPLKGALEYKQEVLSTRSAGAPCADANFVGSSYKHKYNLHDIAHGVVYNFPHVDDDGNWNPLLGGGCDAKLPGPTQLGGGNGSARIMPTKSWGPFQLTTNAGVVPSPPVLEVLVGERYVASYPYLDFMGGSHGKIGSIDFDRITRTVADGFGKCVYYDAQGDKQCTSDVEESTCTGDANTTALGRSALWYQGDYCTGTSDRPLYFGFVGSYTDLMNSQIIINDTSVNPNGSDGNSAVEADRTILGAPLWFTDFAYGIGAYPVANAYGVKTQCACWIDNPQQNATKLANCYPGNTGFPDYEQPCEPVFYPDCSRDGPLYNPNGVDEVGITTAPLGAGYNLFSLNNDYDPTVPNALLSCVSPDEKWIVTTGNATNSGSFVVLNVWNSSKQPDNVDNFYRYEGRQMPHKRIVITDSCSSARCDGFPPGACICLEDKWQNLTYTPGGAEQVWNSSIISNIYDIKFINDTDIFIGFEDARFNLTGHGHIIIENFLGSSPNIKRVKVYHGVTPLNDTSYLITSPAVEKCFNFSESCKLTISHKLPNWKTESTNGTLISSASPFRMAFIYAYDMDQRTYNPLLRIYRYDEFDSYDSLNNVVAQGRFSFEREFRLLDIFDQPIFNVEQLMGVSYGQIHTKQNSDYENTSYSLDNTSGLSSLSSWYNNDLNGSNASGYDFSVDSKIPNPYIKFNAMKFTKDGGKLAIATGNSIFATVIIGLTSSGSNATNGLSIDENQYSYLQSITKSLLSVETAKTGDVDSAGNIIVLRSMYRLTGVVPSVIAFDEGETKLATYGINNKVSYQTDILKSYGKLGQTTTQSWVAQIWNLRFGGITSPNVSNILTESIVRTGKCAYYKFSNNEVGDISDSYAVFDKSLTKIAILESQRGENSEGCTDYTSDYAFHWSLLGGGVTTLKRINYIFHEESSAISGRLSSLLWIPNSNLILVTNRNYLPFTTPNCFKRLSDSSCGEDKLNPNVTVVDTSVELTGLAYPMWKKTMCSETYGGVARERPPISWDGRTPLGCFTGSENYVLLPDGTYTKRPGFENVKFGADSCPTCDAGYGNNSIIHWAWHNPPISYATGRSWAVSLRRSPFERDRTNASIFRWKATCTEKPEWGLNNATEFGYEQSPIQHQTGDYSDTRIWVTGWMEDPCPPWPLSQWNSTLPVDIEVPNVPHGDGNTETLTFSGRLDNTGHTYNADPGKTASVSILYCSKYPSWVPVPPVSDTNPKPGYSYQGKWIKQGGINKWAQALYGIKDGLFNGVTAAGYTVGYIEADPLRGICGSPGIWNASCGIVGDNINAIVDSVGISAAYQSNSCLQCDAGYVEDRPEYKPQFNNTYLSYNTNTCDKCKKIPFIRDIFPSEALAIDDGITMTIRGDWLKSDINRPIVTFNGAPAAYIRYRTYEDEAGDYIEGFIECKLPQGVTGACVVSVKTDIGTATDSTRFRYI